MRHPIQRLHVCPATARLYTATSNSLHVFDGASGALLSSWTAPEPADSPTKTLITEGEKEKPVVAKKRKVEDITASAKKEKKEHVRLSLFAGIASNNAISKILTTADGRHAVVVTSEDKAVTVFSVEMSKLVALSSRWVLVL